MPAAPRPPDELVQVAERALHDAEAAYRLDPSDANRRRVMRAWSQVRAARGEPDGAGADPRLPPYPLTPERPNRPDR